MKHAKSHTLTIAKEMNMLDLGGKLYQAFPKTGIIFLDGAMGAGKTTLVRGFLRGAGFTGKVKSPTYTLVEPYEIAGQLFFHFDFFRLNNPMELEQIGIDEYFSNEAICLIEWAEKGFPYLPEPDIICSISTQETQRVVTLKAGSGQGELVLAKF